MPDAITPAQVSALRSRTGVGIMDCKRALEEAGGNVDKAADLLRERGIARAAARAERVTAEGAVGSYIHLGGRIGVLLELNCETDFVARTPEFLELVKDLAMQVAAAHPTYVDAGSVPEAVLEHEREVLTNFTRSEGKPEASLLKIVEGRLKTFFKEQCLLQQEYIKDPKLTVADRIRQTQAKVGENIVVKRFSRFEVGEK
ncbi:MAG: elongation factor Ts [Deinococcus sp.]|nr:elongation factor Ts [Deinococcus sp.]